MNAKSRVLYALLAAALALGTAAAKHGADDPPGDDRGRHGAGHASVPAAGAPLLARHGADDLPGDDHGHHGAGHA